MPASLLMEGTRVPAWAGPTVESVITKTPKAERTFGEYLSALASAAGYSQAELARASGVNQTQLSRAFNGDTIPEIPTLRKLAPPLGVRLGDLLVASGAATAAELGMRGAPPAPAAPLPAVIRSILSRLASPRYKEHYKNVLMRYVQEDLDRWDGMMELMQEERAEALRGRR